MITFNVDAVVHGVIVFAVLWSCIAVWVGLLIIAARAGGPVSHDGSEDNDE